MSKLVITGAGNGKVTYLVGDEIETSVDEIKARIAEIEETLAMRPDFASERGSIEAKAKEAIVNKANEISGKKAELDQEYKTFVTEVELEKTDLLKDVADREGKYNDSITNLIHERAKLLAILDNLPLDEPVAEDIEDHFEEAQAPVVEEQPVVQEEPVAEEVQEPVVEEAPVVEEQPAPAPVVEEKPAEAPVEKPRKRIIF